MPINSFEHYPMNWKPERSRLKGPYYLALASALEEDIMSGLLPAGTRLPPQRELADFLDLNFTTITRAYKICTQKGLIYAVTGNGTFVSPKGAQAATIPVDSLRKGCIDLGLVSSFEECNCMVTEAVKKTAGRKYLEQLLTYEDSGGVWHHKAAGAKWLEKIGISVPPQEVAIASGGQNALAVTIFGLFSPGHKIAVDEYTYSNFRELAKMFMIKLVPVSSDSKGMIPEELDRICHMNEIQGVFLMPSCANPTTIQIPYSRKKELAQIIKKRNMILIEDDFHAFLTADVSEIYGTPMFSMIPEQTIYISSMSKALCTGLRVAYIAAKGSLLERVQQAMFNLNVKTSALDSEVITELINSGRAEGIVKKKRELASEANAIFRGFFPEIQPIGNPFSFFRWLPIKKSQDGHLFEEEMMKKGIRVFHSDRFLSGIPEKKQFIRVSLASSGAMSYLKEGLQILKNQLIEHRYL
ncbi:MAG: PLP-dependent aminotransferase family protein [Clostridiales bacterium]|nr:PLP-dependent aminotransferase family protein [Clostridiales bacterium]